MRVRSELAYALHIHASRVLLLAVKTPADAHRDNLLCINIAAHKEDVRSKQELASTLAPALGTHASSTRESRLLMHAGRMARGPTR
jgi:hypothetical protein